MKRISPVLNTIIETVRRHRMLTKDDTVVVGISGGPDSVALLCTLEEVGRIKRLKFKLHLVHINHMIRARQADDDERFVRDLAGLKGLGLSVYRRDIRRIAKRRKKSIWISP